MSRELSKEEAPIVSESGESRVELVFPDRRGSDSSKWDTLESRFGRDDILPMWVADADYSAPEAVQKALMERVRHPVYGYTVYPERYFDAIAHWYRKRFGWEIEKEWIVPEQGVVISMNVALGAICEDGDGVIVQTPIYPPFLSSVSAHGLKLLENRLVYRKGRYGIDFDSLERSAREAKAMLLCSPHNPTTRSWSREELERISDICREHGVVVLSDEIHSDMVHTGEHIPFGSLEGADAFSMTFNAPSKTFNIAGLNASYAIIENPELRARYIQSAHRTGLDNGNCFGITALPIAYEEGGDWLESAKRYVEENIALVHDYLRSHIPQIRAVPTEATFLVWLDCRGLGMCDGELSSFFIDEARVGLNEGVSFGSAGSGFMRMNVGCSREMVREALERIRSAVERSSSRDWREEF
jgi:cystathionine beta-lyase